MKNFNTVLFDVDDTLVDFKASEILSLKSCYERYFKKIPYMVFLQDYTRINRRLWDEVEKRIISPKIVGQKRFQELAELHQLPFTPSIPDLFEQGLVDHATWIEGATALLENLKKTNIKIGFVTNGLTRVQRGKYKHLGVARFTEVLVISEEVGFAKPQPQIFQIALKELNAKAEETLMVGDSLSSDGEGARNLGISFCWYNPKKAAHSLTWQPDLTISSWEEFTLRK